ncbi:hypothetical protein DSECCO2_591980 [anaerobic digester metagenome]
MTAPVGPMISLQHCILRLQHSSSLGILPCSSLSPESIRHKLSRMNVKYLRNGSDTPRKTRKPGRRNTRRKSSWSHFLCSIVPQPWNWASISLRSIPCTCAIYLQQRQTTPSVQDVQAAPDKLRWWYRTVPPKAPMINGSSITRMRWSMVRSGLPRWIFPTRT